MALTGPALLAAPSTVNALVAVVNGQVITQSEVDEAVSHTRQMIEVTVPPGAERERQLGRLHDDALNSLIERELILAEFAKIGGAIKEELVEEDVNKIIASERFGGDRQKFLDELKRTGMSLKRFKDLRRKILVVEIMRSRQGQSVPFVTPGQIEAAYAKHGDKFRGEAFIRLRTLMIPKVTADEAVTSEDQRAHITAIRKRILGGEDFAQMARTYSQDSVAEAGGDRGTVGESNKEVREDLLRAAFTLNAGQVSKVLEDPYAFYLLKADAKQLGKRNPLSDKDVRETCERLAMLDMRREAHERWIAKLRRNASIRVFDSSGKVIAYTPPEPSTPSARPGPAPRPAPAPAGGVPEQTAGAEHAPEEKRGFGSRIPKPKLPSLPKIPRPFKRG